MDQIRWTVTLPHDRWLMVGEHGCSPRNATAEDVTLAGYVPAADLAAQVRHAAQMGQERDSLRAKLAEAQAENTRFHEAFLVQRDCVVRDLRARLDRYAALERAVSDWVYKDTEMSRERLRTVFSALSALSSLTPAPGATEEGSKAPYAGEWPECEGCENDLHNGASCRKGHWHAVECKANGFNRRTPAKPDTCGESYPCRECAQEDGGICTVSGGHSLDEREGDEPCPAFVRRLPVVVEQERCKTCAHDKGSLCQAEPGGIDCWRDGGYVSWSPRPAAQEVE